MKVVPAEGALLDEIIAATFPIWNEGLTPQGYAKWNAAQLRTPWGRQHLQRLALVDHAGHLLATAKRYHYPIRLDGREGIMCGFGAVFTPPERRGHGYAQELLRRVMAEEEQNGTLLAGLFSEIGAAFYERVGFRTVTLDEVTVTIEPKSGTPAMLVRAGDERDLPDIAAMHETRAATSPFALRRDASLVHYALSKKRLLAGLGPPGLRQVEFFVAEEGSSAVAYVVLSQNQYGWTLEEAGDRDPAAARLGAILQVLAAREPSHTLPLIRAWWPRALAIPPQLELTDRADARDLFMVRPLAHVTAPQQPEDVFYWRSDYF